MPRDLEAPSLAIARDSLSQAPAPQGFSLGLRVKAMIVALCLTLLSSVPPIVFFYVKVRRAIDGELRDKAQVIAGSLARNSAGYLVVGDVEGLERLRDVTLASKETSGDILYVAIAGSAGDMLSSREAEGSAAAQALQALRSRRLSPVASIELRALPDGHTYYDVVAPVLRESKSGADDLSEPGGPESAPAGLVAIGFSRTRTEGKIREILSSCIGVTLATVVLGLIAAALVTQLAMRPIAELSRTAGIMAEGDLTRSVDVRSGDEIGRLSRSFALMADSLKVVLRRINAASGAADDTVKDATGAARRIVTGSERQSDSVTASSAAILEMDSTIKDVARSAERMTSSVVSTTTSLEEMGSSIRQIDESVTALQVVTSDASSSVLQMGANIGEVAESIDELSSQVERTASSINLIATSIENVSERARDMRGSAEATAHSIEDMGKSIREVGGHAKAASDLAQKVTQDVGEGRRAVRSTSDGMRTIRTSFEETRAAISGLLESSRRIGEIVDIIDDVADRTSLLSLNAAIIAAEAGEQGRAFAVVSEEIRELAVKTAASTRDIAAIVRSVQEEVGRVLARTEESDRFVTEGVDLASRADQSLELIHRASVSSMEMAALIESATVSQLERGVLVIREMERLKEQALGISAATTEQARTGKTITEAVAEMRDKAVMVKRASAEQKLGGDRIAGSMEKVTEMIQQIARATREQASNAKLLTDGANEVEKLALEVGRATKEQAKSSAQVVTGVEVIAEVTRENTQLADDMGQRLSSLAAQMAELRKLVLGLRLS